MAEQETIYDTKMKFEGIFNLRDFYQFIYSWQDDEIGLNVGEKSYVERIKGDMKEIEFEWYSYKKVTDYFKFIIKTKCKIIKLKNIEVSQGGKKISTNQGEIEMKVKGILQRDYDGKFEKNAFQKFLRAIYEKWVIRARIEQFEDDLISKADEFLAQSKAYLDLETKK